MSGQYDGWRDYTGPVKGEAVIAPPAPKTRSKYGARPHRVLPDLRVLPAEECAAVPGGIRFDSKREADRFVALMGEQERGVIKDLTLQPALTLHATSPAGIKVAIGRYIADFSYLRDNGTVYEDAKGLKTAIYQRSKKHVEAEYGIRILET